ncbi:hypothetical protein SCLCIDRAFT_258859 [Scleroderma citrinum Foug A]|uniref:Uncharacterized protein n=1 Tax=Scleroderma citrinum Foug A TaxID=1036808 RepID=A0A0C3EG25_9AGAM|nr:hypothetical protein SCLCIDRAFT_258859 [Scleroderma citrinum Foug A]
MIVPEAACYLPIYTRCWLLTRTCTMSLLVHDDASLQLYANCVGAFRFFSALFVPSNATSPSTKGSPCETIPPSSCICNHLRRLSRCDI